LPESAVEARVRDLYGEPGSDVTILSGAEGIELHLRVRAADAEAARAALEALEHRFRERLGGDLYGCDDDTLPAVVGAALRRRGLTVATAESCTGGLVAAALTRVAGSSAWFRGGLVVYADDLKVALAGVDPALLHEHGAVSAPVATALARAARERAAADVGIGVSGIAGPGGGTPGKPVGLVHVALADAAGELAREARLVGDRALVRQRAVSWVLDLLRRRLAERDR
jgi:nicotinamide-nucleotide amidase